VNIAVITVDGSSYGLRVLNALQRAGQPVRFVIVVEDTLQRRWKLLRLAARHVGWVDAFGLAVARLREARSEQGDRTWRGAPLNRNYRELADDVIRVGVLKEPSVAAALEDAEIDLLLLGQSGIVPVSVLEVPRLGTLNAHPGVLPAYRGLDAALWAMLHNDFEHVGSTLHLVDATIDTGPIVLRRAYSWTGDETAQTLEHRVYEDCIDLLLEGVEGAERGALTGEPQHGGSYYGLVSRRLRADAERRLDRFLRG